MQAGRLRLPSSYIEAEPLDRHSQVEPGNEEIGNFILILARRPPGPSPTREEGVRGKGRTVT